MTGRTSGSAAPGRHAWRLAGPVSEASLRRALERVGEAGAPARPVLTSVDLRHSVHPEDELGPLAVDQARLAVGDGDALRVCLVRVDEREHVLLVHPRRAAHLSVLHDFVADLLDLHAGQTGVPGVPRGGSRKRFARLLSPPPHGPAAPEQPPLPADPRPPGRAAGSASTAVPVTPVDSWCARHRIGLPDFLVAGLAVLVAGHTDVTAPVLAVDLPSTGSPVDVVLPLSAGGPAELVSAVSGALRRPGDHPPLSRVSFSYADRPAPLYVGGVRAEVVDVDTGSTGRDLAVSVTRADGLLHVRVDGDAPRLLLDRLVAVWDRLAGPPGRFDLDVRTEAERELTRTASAGPAVPVPDRCVHHLVEDHARRVPDREAVVCGADRITYGALDARANGVAHVLRDLGVGPEERVAVLADRSVDAVVAVLGVLKAGAGYVPVDPAYPPERIGYVLADSSARVTVGSAKALAGLGAAGPAQVDVRAVPPADHPPEVGSHPDDLVYVIYTSGSTGRPKGVAVTHRSLVLSTTARLVGGEPPGTDLLTMPLVFDGSASGMYWTLTAGGTLVLPTDEEVRDPRRVAVLAEREAVTHVHSIPSYYSLLDEACGDGGLPLLKMVSVGGEPLPPRLVAAHLTRHPGALLLNDYGPTEATVWAAANPCDVADALSPRVPIGPPLPNYRLHVLDGSLRPVPPGVPGELYIGGGGVARGYLGRFALTAERFLPDPFGDVPGGRLYRTGDRARLLPDGRFDVLGRVDGQVKVRGFRVEPGEVENTLLRNPSVVEAAVLPTGEGAASQLTAYVVIRGSASAAGLRAWLGDRLPGYMVPDRIRLLPALPRNHNGKVDARALVREEGRPVGRTAHPAR